ncbi:restriction endonuclease subunit S [Holdemanella porci]|uniref:restriction endonuclease subunit S n=1 Tax=Holdemanella porci TaxID=2652276 RepID=UPI003F90AFE2
MKIKDLCSYAPKSRIKAGEAVENAKYLFFTSSADENKRYTDFQFDKEAIIMGTGGNATLHYYNGKFSVSTDCLVLFPNSKIKCKYLYYFFKSHMSVLEAGFKGAGLKHTNKKYIEEINVSKVPDLSTQEKIVSHLDTITENIEKLNRELELFDSLTKARFVEMFGEPVNNPKKFEKRSLKDTCKIVTGNTPSRAVEEYYGDFVEWIKTDNIISGEINPTRAVEYLSEEGMKVGRVVEEDAILMACIAGSIASIGRVCVTDRTVAFNQQINAIVPYDYNQLFLYVLLQISKDYLIEDVSMALKGILSKSKLEEKEFIVPPIELQNQFADFVRQVDKSREEVKKSLEKTQQLYDSLMQEYFG